jgi:hypothetical protein
LASTVKCSVFRAFCCGLPLAHTWSPRSVKKCGRKRLTQKNYPRRFTPSRFSCRKTTQRTDRNDRKLPLSAGVRGRLTLFQY